MFKITITAIIQLETFIDLSTSGSLPLKYLKTHTNKQRERERKEGREGREASNHHKPVITS